MFSYHTYGNGDELYLAFHGFGQDASIFAALGNSYKVIAFDLPHHGDLALSYQNEKEFITAFKAFFADFKHAKVALIAYSIGCRVAFSLLQHFPERFHTVKLLAPDGLQIHPLYSFSTGTWLGCSLFKWLMNSKWWLSPSFYFLQKSGLFPAAMIKMARAQLGTHQRRMRVYHTWMAHRDFNVDLELLIKNIQKHQLKIEFVLGKSDSIIQYRHIEPLCKALEDYPYNVQLLDCGHFHLVQQYFKRMH